LIQALLSVGIWVPLKPVLWGVRDVGLIMLSLMTYSINMSLQLWFYCFLDFFHICLYHQSKCQVPSGSGIKLPRYNLPYLFRSLIPALLSAINNSFRVVYWKPCGALLFAFIVPEKPDISDHTFICQLCCNNWILNFVDMPLHVNYFLTIFFIALSVD
jgi:hypothetical protein